MQLLAARFLVVCALTGVDDLGDVFPMVAVEPLGEQAPRAWLDFGCWVNRHFVAVVKVESTPPPPSAPSAATDEMDYCHRCGGTGFVKDEQCLFCNSGLVGAQQAEELAEWQIFDWPISSTDDFLRLLQCRYIRPEALVGFEFSGSMRSSLEARGIRAISADFRECDIG